MSLEIKYFGSQKEAAGAMLKDDKEYFSVRHALVSGEGFPLHSHWVDEIIIFPNKADIRLDFSHQAFTPDFKPGPVGAIRIPAGLMHGIKVHSAVDYWVYREKLPRSPIKLLNCWLNTVFNRSISQS